MSGGASVMSASLTYMTRLTQCGGDPIGGDPAGSVDTVETVGTITQTSIKERCVVYDLADIERRLDAGKPLLIGEVAALLDVSRSTVHRMLRRGEIRYSTKPGAGGYRECIAEDVRRELAKRRQEHRGDPDPDRSGE